MGVADGTFRTVEYEHFYIESESNGYRLHVAGADGNAGDALGATAAARNVANGMMFSTPDRDNDNKDNFNCAQETNSGWWMNYCSGSNLNGEFKDSTGLGWAECYRGHCMQWSTVPAPFDTKALMASEMKIMPNKDYELQSSTCFKRNYFLRRVIFVCARTPHGAFVEPCGAREANLLPRADVAISLFGVSIRQH